MIGKQQCYLVRVSYNLITNFCTICTDIFWQGLRVTIDCKPRNGELFERRGVGELDEEGKFRVSLPEEIVEDDRSKLKEECYAQLHSASAAPCPAYDGLESSRIVFKTEAKKEHTFGLAGKLKFSPVTCASEFFWPHLKYPPPLFKFHPFPELPLPPPKNFHHHLPHPPPKNFHHHLPFPPFPKKPFPPPVSISYPPAPPKALPPPVPKSLPPPVPKKSFPPNPPVIKKPCPPVPKFKPLPPIPKVFPPKPPLFKKPYPLPKVLPPPFPIYKPKPPVPIVLPPPFPIYKPIPPVPKVFPPAVPNYNPKPYFFTPLPPFPKIPPFHKSLNPPLTKLPPKYFHHPKFGKLPPWKPFPSYP